jgi:hypothetical protein
VKLDLDAKRRARSEAINKPHEVTFGGEEFSLPVRIPLECLDLMAEARFRDAFEVLLWGDPELTERFFKHRPDDGDLEEIMGLYGEPGESSGSPVSSRSNGSRSRPTSRRATTSTSRKRATELTPVEADGSSSS